MNRTSPGGESRPDPDQLLAHVQAEEARANRGKLRIFFGASAGVGKTFSMLEAARVVKAAGTDVVIGYLEPHGRVETERLAEGLERLPTLAVSYRGIVRHEFDLDAALARRPGILLVDELAHSNLTGGVPQPRHPKRWQDIEEVLEAGINVWTTVNVQHIESLNDLIYQTTGVRQSETLPDRVFDEADNIELIDLPADDLLARLQAGKVYVADAAAATAVERFFRKPNLMALREIALRRVAERVEAASRALHPERARARIAGERILVAVGPDDQAEQLVRAGKRMADAMAARWTVVYVETPALLHLSDADRNRRIDVLRLAESLGAETVTLDGPSAAAALLEYAQTRRATRLVVGAPKRRAWKAWVRPSTSTHLVRNARGFDVVVIAPAGGPPASPSSAARPGSQSLPQTIRWERYGWALGVSAMSTLLAFAMYPRFELSNLAMVYLLGVTVAGLRLGRGPSALTAVVNVTAFAFCFVPPRFTFAISDVQYVITFAAMLTIGLVISTLTANVRRQTSVAGARERRTAMLYAMSRELAVTRGIEEIARVAVRHVAEVFQCSAVVLLPDEEGKLRRPSGAPTESSFRGADLAVAQWVGDHGRRAGLGSDTLPAAPALYVPLGDEQRHSGVLAVLPTNPRRVLLPEQSHLLDTFAGQIGLAIERARLADVAQTSSLAAERESLRNTLLASISHDLRTPLAVMAGAASTLAERGEALDAHLRATLAASIERKAREMSDLVSNVLDLTRFQSGQVALLRDWQWLEDLVGAALERLEERLKDHAVDLNLPPDLPPVHVDAGLIVQVFANLLDNIAKYTPAGTHARVNAAVEGSLVRVVVEDEGPGFPPGDPEQLFEKFQRGSGESAVAGAGLGLAICRAIVRAHGGEIEAHRREGGGARFEFTLPTGESA